MASTRMVSPRAKLTDEIISKLRADITSRRLKNGERLPNERELAQQFGVSQPTIREVIRALDSMGLVDVKHGSGAYVRADSAFLLASALQTFLHLEHISIMETLDVREFLARESARMAAQAASDDDIAALRQSLVDLERAQQVGDVEEVISAIAAFQFCLGAAAHNSLLYAVEMFFSNLILQIQHKLLGRRGAKFWRERSAGFNAERHDILDAVVRRDGPAAFSAMESYLERQRKLFKEDRVLSKMRLSDPRAVEALEEVVLAARNGKPANQ